VPTAPEGRLDVVMAKAAGAAAAVPIDRVTVAVAVLPNLRAAELESVTLTPKE